MKQRCLRIIPLSLYRSPADKIGQEEDLKLQGLEQEIKVSLFTDKMKKI